MEILRSIAGSGGITLKFSEKEKREKRSHVAIVLLVGGALWEITQDRGLGEKSKKDRRSFGRV